MSISRFSDGCLALARFMCSAQAKELRACEQSPRHLSCGTRLLRANRTDAETDVLPSMLVTLRWNEIRVLLSTRGQADRRTSGHPPDVRHRERALRRRASGLHPL